MEDSINGDKDLKLFGYAGLSGSDHELLIACQICLRVCSPLGDMSLLSIASSLILLADSSRPRDIDLATRLIETATAALIHHGQDRLLDQVLLKVVDLEENRDDCWVAAMSAFLGRIDEASASVRLSVWWRLFEQTEEEDKPEPLVAARAVVLCTPIPHHLDAAAILQGLPAGAPQQWAQDYTEVAKVAQLYLLPPTDNNDRSSVKRKRDDLPDVLIRGHLARKYPELVIPEGHDIMATLASMFKAYVLLTRLIDPADQQIRRRSSYHVGPARSGMPLQ